MCMEPNQAQEDGEKKVQTELSQSLGLPVNNLGMLAYASGVFPYFGWLSGLLVLFLEKDKRIRFHAYQALALFGVLDILMLLVDQTVILGRLNQLLWVGRFVLWLLLMLRTYEGKKWVLPRVGDWAARQAGR